MRTLSQPHGHPDANLLSAFAEKSLGKGALAQVLQHLSACANCREILSLSIIPTETSVLSTYSASRRWLSWPVLRWSAVAACVVVVAAVVTVNREHRLQLASKNDVTVVNSQSRQLAQTAPNSVVVPVNPVSKDAVNPAPAPVVMADARTSSPFAGTVPGRAKEPIAQSPQSNSNLAVAGLATRTSMTADAQSELLPAENLTPRWTLSAEGTLERSLDSGRSWQTIPIAKRITFRALAATGLEIWVGGSAGALYHSSDAGQHWRQVQPTVDSESLSDDIIGVVFTDTQHGKLTTSNDETWTTQDSGKTWDKR